MSDIMQTVKSVIAKLPIARNVGVCSCLVKVTYTMVIKFPNDPKRTIEKIIFGKTPLSDRLVELWFMYSLSWLSFQYPTPVDPFNGPIISQYLKTFVNEIYTIVFSTKLLYTSHFLSNVCSFKSSSQNNGII